MTRTTRTIHGNGNARARLRSGLAVLLVAGLAALLTTARPASADPAPRVAARFYVRGGPLHLSPLENSSEVTLTGVEGLATLAIDNGPIAGSRAELPSLTVPALVVGYTLPWGSGRISVETIVAMPLTIAVRAGGTLASESLAPYALDVLPTGVPPLGTELGETRALPPVLTLVYRPLSHGRPLSRGQLQPYLGAGISYLYTYDSKITNPVLREVSEPRLDIGDAVGAVAQAGIELGLTGRFFASLDIKYIAGFDISATVTGARVRTPALPLFESVRVGNATVNMAIDPLIVHATVGAYF